MNSSRDGFYRGSRERYESTYRLHSVNRSGWGDEAQQLHAYSAILECIVGEGSILDLGCGDGSLLHHILCHSPFLHEPFGIDFLERSIEQAREATLPEFAGNFSVGNVADLVLPRSSFRYIIACPEHVAPEDQADFVTQVTSRVEPGGRLILHEYAGSTAFRSFEERVSALLPRRLAFRSSAWVKLGVLDFPAPR